MPDVKSKLRRWLPCVLKLLIVALVVWFIRGMIAQSWRDLRAHSFHVDFGWLATAGVLYLVGTLCCGLFWHRTLRALDQPIGPSKALRAFFIGHLGKYVPGKAMVVVIRAGMVRGPGVDASLAVASVFFETLTMMSVGAFLAAAVAAAWFRTEPFLLASSSAMLVVAGLPTLPPVFRRIVRLAGFGKLKPETLAKLDGLGYGVMLAGWLLNTAGWAALGASYWAVLRALGAEADLLDGMPFYVAAVSLATVLGFASFVPGGAVVREAALAKLTELLAPQLGGTMALVAAVLLRLAWLAAELLAAAALWMKNRDSG